MAFWEKVFWVVFVDVLFVLSYMLISISKVAMVDAVCKRATTAIHIAVLNWFEQKEKHIRKLSEMHVDGNVN